MCGLQQPSGYQGVVGVCLFVVDGDVADVEFLIGCAQLHEQAQDLEDHDGDEHVPDDDGQRGAELDEDLCGVVAPDPARGGDVGDVFAVAQVFDDLGVGEHPDQQAAQQPGHAVGVDDPQRVVDLAERCGAAQP